MTAISLDHYRFHLEPKAPLRMPAYNEGSTLRLTPERNVIRGGFGGRFRRRDLNAVFVIVLVSSEPHGAAIGAAARNILERISKNRDIPRPLVIKPPMERQDNYQPGERLSFDVVFVG